MNKKEQELFLIQIGHGGSDKFLSDVVHKIKNNLGGISGFASLLERELRPNDPRKKLLHRIIDGVHRFSDRGIPSAARPRCRKAARDANRTGCRIGARPGSGQRRTNLRRRVAGRSRVGRADMHMR